MAQRKDDSALISLAALQQIHEQRVTTEKDAERSRVDAERAAKVEAERQARLAIEAQQNAAEEAERQARLDSERQARDARVAEAEAQTRARIGAEVAEQQRQIRDAAEAKARAYRIPWGRIGAVIGVLAVVTVGLSVFFVNKSKEAEGRKAQEVQLLVEKKAAEDKLRADRERYQQEADALEKAKAELATSLATAKSDTERDVIRGQIAARNAKESRLEARRRKAADRSRRRRRGKKPADPLGGLGL